MRKTWKRMTSLLLTLTLLCSLATLAFAAKTAITVTLNGSPLTQASGAYLDVNNRTQVPVAAGEALGLTVSREGDRVTFSNAAASITFENGSSQAGSITMDTTADVTAGYVPLTYLTQHFGYQVSWNSSTKTVAITTAAGTTAVSLDSYDLSTIQKPVAPNRLPLTGYFDKALEVGGVTRSAKIYIAADAPIRTYFTVIAVPEGVSTDAFLRESGWMAYADSMKEGLYILESANGVWGDIDSELAYMTEAIKWLNASFSINGTKVLSTFGIHYFVGYGAGSAPLEAWVAQNPLRAIAQAYVGSSGVSAAVLNEAGATVAGLQAGAYTPITAPITLTYVDMVMPTLYVTADAATLRDSLNYWRAVNDVVETAAPGTGVTTYHQNITSTRWMTEYWNGILKAQGAQYGFAKVVVNQQALKDYTTYTNEIVSFLTGYTRYENALVYGNTLAERADYDALGITVEEVNLGSVEGLKNSARRQYLLYIPDGYSANSAAPLVVVLPGNSQTNRVFMDATQWWQVARENDFILAVLCEDYNEADNWTTVSHYDTDAFINAVVDAVSGRYNVDSERIYLSGQSAGSGASQAMGVLLPERFAAIASTSALPGMEDPGASFYDFFGNAVEVHETSNAAIPIYLMYGEGDLGVLNGGIWNSIKNESNVDFMPWAEYHLANWNLTLGAEATRTTSEYIYTNTTANANHGYETRAWFITRDGNRIPVFQVSQTDNRAHNCYAAEMPELWNYMKQFKVVDHNDGTYTRYYNDTAIYTGTYR